MNDISFNAHILSPFQMINYLETDNFIEDPSERLIYVYPHDISQNYICVFSDEKINDTWNKMIGVLVMGLNSQGNNVIYGVSVDPDYRKKGIAKQMINDFFSYSKEQNLGIEISSYTPDGKAYLSHHIEDQLNQFQLEQNTMYSP